MDKDILVGKFDLVDSPTYKQIKEFQLENILKLANSDIEPLVLKGMLKVIADTDKWKAEFLNEKKRLGGKT